MPKSFHIIKKTTNSLWMGLTFLFLFGCISYQEEPTSPVVRIDPPPPPAPPGPPAVVPPAGMVLLSEATFEMGDKDLKIDPLSVTVSSFYLDQTEVTADAYQACVVDKKCTAPARGFKEDPLCNWDNKKTPARVAVGRKQHPMNCVTFLEAQAYCVAQGKRLPTEIEWEYAAKGTQGSLYPWGADVPSNQDPIDRACWNGAVGTCAVKEHSATLLGSKISDSTQVGLYDMAGNVWEWLDTQYAFELSNTNVPCTNQNLSCRIRGASWADADPMALRSSFRFSLRGKDNLNNLGFRCAKSLGI